MLPYAGELWASTPGTGSGLLLLVLRVEASTRKALCLYVWVERSNSVEKEGAIREMNLSHYYYERLM